jgi:hypothetical protein
MKKLAGIILLTIFCKIATAQVIIALLFGEKLNTGKVEFGLVVAPGITDISDIESDKRNGLNLGLYFNIRPDKKFFLYVEGTAKGSFGAKGMIPYSLGSDTLDHLFASGSVERKIKAFGLPVMGRYTITPKFFVDAGIQADMMLSAKDIFKTKINDNDLEYTVKTSDIVTLLDFGLIGGLHYKFSKDKRSMGIGIRYFQGLTDILKTTPGTQVNFAWQLVISIPVGVGKSTSTSPGDKDSAK